MVPRRMTASSGGPDTTDSIIVLHSFTQGVQHLMSYRVLAGWSADLETLAARSRTEHTTTSSQQTGEATRCRRARAALQRSRGAQR